MVACNSNGILDKCDIISGFSDDCNFNGVPDECDVSTGDSLDCNDNDIPDECDLWNGTSLDSNNNDIPDECEGGFCGFELYCDALPNSTGLPGEIGYSGTASIASNDLMLKGSVLPGTQFGVFYHGINQIQVPFGDGVRCVGGGIKRFPVVQTSSLGDVSYSVDYADPAHSDELVPGATRNFQFWFRDPIGGPNGFNLTNALQITFCD